MIQMCVTTVEGRDTGEQSFQSLRRRDLPSLSLTERGAGISSKTQVTRPTSTHTQSRARITAHVPILDLTVYINIEGYMKFPRLILMISNHPVTFLVDSGATSSVLRTDALPHPPERSGRTCLTLGSSGVPILENCSGPLRCELDDQMTKHSFLCHKTVL